MFKINLIPEVKQQQQKVNRLNTVVTTSAIVVGVCLLGIGLLLGGYFVTRKAQIMSIEGSTATLNDQLKTYSSLKDTVVSLETGLAAIKSIGNSDDKWQLVFAQVEKATPNDIRFKSFAVDGNNHVTASLEGSSVTSIDRFIKSFENFNYNGKPLFLNVDVTGYTSSGSTVQFNSTFDIDPSVLTSTETK